MAKQGSLRSGCIFSYISTVIAYAVCNLHSITYISVHVYAFSLVHAEYSIPGTHHSPLIAKSSNCHVRNTMRVTPSTSFSPTLSVDAEPTLPNAKKNTKVNSSVLCGCPWLFPSSTGGNGS